jgi:hypothetical protein
MPSQAYRRWRSSARAELDELADAHRAVGGDTRGGRYATQQVNRAYAVLLASHFQRYCRDLHTECVDHIVAVMQPVNVRPLVRAEMVRDRKLDRGNATPGNIGADFGRLRLPFWPTLQTFDPATPSWIAELDSMNAWRNAIAHQDFDPTKLGGTMVLRLRRVRQWQAVCNRIVSATDRMLRGHLHSVVGQHPW